MKKNIVKLLRLGRLSYEEALKVQEARVKSLQNGHDHHFLIFVEHNPVYTVGIRRKEYGPDIASRLRSLGADYVTTNRGGLITFHGPGQLVVYPIINLATLVGNRISFKNRREFSLLGMRWYIDTLEQTVIDLLRSAFDVEACRSPHTGVWVGDNKICAMGVHNSNLITSHGLALNCNVDLKWFDHIVPCGIKDKGVTSLSRELNRDVTVREAEDKIISYFERNFQCSVVD